MSTQDNSPEESTPPVRTTDPVLPEETVTTPTEQISAGGTAAVPAEQTSATGASAATEKIADTEQTAITAQEPVGGATEELPAAVTTEEPLSATQALPTSAAPSPTDWRTAEYAGHSQATGATPPGPTPTPGPTSTPDGAVTEPSGPPTGRTTWTSQVDPGTDATSLGGPGDTPSAHTPWSPADRPPEAPARGVRVGLLIWAGVVLLLGVFLIALTLLPTLDTSTALIGLVALLGVGLIVAAMGMSRGPRDRGPQV